MAHIFPDLTQVLNLHQKPTKGEWHLLNFLKNNLDDTYEVYFQPFINGDRPDVILMHPHSGVMIIEVKDWNLKNYRINEKKQWLVINNQKKWSIIKSPIEQVRAYKQNMYDLHIETLLERQIKNSKTWGIVSCAVYFYNEVYQDAYKFLTENFQQDKKYLNDLQYFYILEKETLTKENFQKVLQKHHLDRKSIFFDEVLYKSFR
jgi:hypothetical protein